MRLKRKTNSEKKEKRANTVLTEEQKEANRAKECKRKQRYREKKKKGLKLSNAILKNKYTKGMAMKKVSKTLSKTPAKKIEVIRTLATSLSQRQR